MDDTLALTLFLFFWGVWGISLQMIAKKTETPNGWFGWVPVLNVILMIQIAQKPWWWFLLLMIPFVNIVVAVLLFMGVAYQVNRPGWVGAMTLVPVIGWFVLPYLAFTGKEDLN